LSLRFKVSYLMYAAGLPTSRSFTSSAHGQFTMN
jgi:hypothetical protein